MIKQKRRKMEIFKQFSDDMGTSKIMSVPDDTLQKLTDWMPARSWRLRIFEPGTFLDWHPAEGKLLSVVLSGEFEIGTSDGKSFRCKPGMLRIVSDTGKGHTARVIGNDPCLLLMIDITDSL